MNNAITALDHAIIDTDTLEPTIDPTFALVRAFLQQARELVIPYHDPARFTEYQIANFLAEYAVELTRGMVKPLHVGDLLPMGHSRDNVEWALKFYFQQGYIPSIVYPESRFWLPLALAALPKVDQAWVESEPKPKYTKETHKRKCPECHEWRELTSEHWHRNPNGLLGWHSICKLCRNGVESQRIAVKRAA